MSKGRHEREPNRNCREPNRKVQYLKYLKLTKWTKTKGSVNLKANKKMLSVKKVKASVTMGWYPLVNKAKIGIHKKREKLSPKKYLKK